MNNDDNDDLEALIEALIHEAAHTEPDVTGRAPLSGRETFALWSLESEFEAGLRHDIERGERASRMLDDFVVTKRQGRWRYLTDDDMAADQAINVLAMYRAFEQKLTQ